MNKKPKLLYWTDNASVRYIGQSVVAREVLKRLQDNYEVENLGFGGVDPDGKPVEIANPVEVPYNVIPCNRMDVRNPDKIANYIKQSNPDIVLFSHDAFLCPYIGAIRQKVPNVKFIGWITADGFPIPYMWYSMLKPYDKIITPSKFSTEAINDKWLDLNIETIPYGVNHELFHPPKQGKEKLKSELHVQSGSYLPMHNRFVALYVGANQDRKNLGLIHEAWREFEKGKEGSVLMLLFTHSASLTDDIGSYDLSVFLQDTKTLIVNNTPQPDDIIGACTAASDVLFHPCTGEGFGLTIASAMAAGTPPITVNYSGHTQFCNEENSYFIPHTHFVGGFHTHRAVCSIENTVAQLELAFKDKDLREKKALKGIETAKEYTWDRTAKELSRVIDEVLSYKPNEIRIKRIVG